MKLPGVFWDNLEHRRAQTFHLQHIFHILKQLDMKQAFHFIGCFRLKSKAEKSLCCTLSYFQLYISTIFRQEHFVLLCEGENRSSVYQNKQNRNVQIKNDEAVNNIQEEPLCVSLGSFTSQFISKNRFAFKMSGNNQLQMSWFVQPTAKNPNH